MKRILFFALVQVVIVSTAYAQPIQNNPANLNAAGANSFQYWSRQGNTLNQGTNNVFGFQANHNSQIWFATNGFYRMMMNNGVGGNADGRIAMGNSLPGTFNPLDRLHLHQTGGTTAIRFSNGATGFTVNDGLQVGVLPLGAGIIRHHMAARSILIGTNNGAAGTADRMRIGSFAENGFVAVGTVNFFPSPLALMHLTNLGPTVNMANPTSRGEMFRSDGDGAVDNTWRLFTTTPLLGIAERFSINAVGNNSNVIVRSAIGNMIFETGIPTANNGFTERMSIRNGIGNQAAAPVNNATKVSISYGGGIAPIANPVAMLNLGLDAPLLPNGGQRNWMDVGTFMCANSDNMYVGLKNEDPGSSITGGDRMDAVINWGDNITFPAPFGPENLRFIFTSLQNPATTSGSASQNGLEAMRMTPINNNIVFTGIGGDPTINLYGPLQNSPNPTATLEVNSPANVISPVASGLRFTDLNATATPIANPGQGVLAVSANGDVIYVQAGAVGAPFGGNCGNTNNMTADWEIPMNGFNYVFSGQGATGNNVGIGFPAATCTPIAKLDVRQASGNNNSWGINSVNSDIDGIALRAVSNGGATGTCTKVAGWFQSNFANGQNQIAVFVPLNGGAVQVGYPSPQPNAGLVDVDGTIYATGAITQFSDVSAKQNVSSLTGGMQIVSRLNPVSYTWNNNVIRDSLMTGTHFGFIAQQVDTVIPEIVHPLPNGMMGISYTEIIPYLVKALQEEHSRNDSLAQRLTQLEGTVAGCCSTNARENTSHVHNTDVTLSNTAGIVLNQNVPNPFAEQTVIAYQLPDNVRRAQILFYDAQGKLIQTVELTNRGAGQLTVFADDLSSGIYTYALVADGAVVDTKKMVKQ